MMEDARAHVIEQRTVGFLQISGNLRYYVFGYYYQRSVATRLIRK